LSEADEQHFSIFAYSLIFSSMQFAMVASELRACNFSGVKRFGSRFTIHIAPHPDSFLTEERDTSGLFPGANC
jgi:hypothetical protein